MNPPSGLILSPEILSPISLNVLRPAPPTVPNAAQGICLLNGSAQRVFSILDLYTAFRLPGSLSFCRFQGGILFSRLHPNFSPFQDLKFSIILLQHCQENIS
jgi:hypothetical protein